MLMGPPFTKKDAPDLYHGGVHEDLSPVAPGLRMPNPRVQPGGCPWLLFRHREWVDFLLLTVGLTGGYGLKA